MPLILIFCRIPLGQFSEVRKIVGDALDQKINGFINGLAAQIRSDLSCAKVSPMQVSETFVQEMLKNRFAQKEFQMRTFFESTLLFLGPCQKAPNKYIKFIDILIYERFTRDKRTKILKDELDIVLPEEMETEVSNLTSLADGIAREAEEKDGDIFARIFQCYKKGLTPEEAVQKAGVDPNDNAVRRFLEGMRASQSP